MPCADQPNAQTISQDVLDWGSKLACGDLVHVLIPLRHAAKSGAMKEVSAVIRYIGPVKSLPEITFGVEITVCIEYLKVLCVCECVHACVYVCVCVYVHVCVT